MRVLQVCGLSSMAGAAIARQAMAIGREVRRRGGSSAIWFLGGEGPLCDAARRDGHDVRVVPWTGDRRDVPGALRFARAIRGARVDVVHQHDGGSAVRALVRAGSRARVVLHVHARIIEPRGLALVRVNARWADAVIANSAATAERVHGPSLVVHPGVALPRSLADASAHPPVVGITARLVRLKGIDVALRAFAIAASRMPALRLEIGGDGPERGALEALVAQLALGDRVRFLGWCDDVPAMLHGWQIQLVPSLEEAFGVSALEGMASGLPIVASRVGGLPELVRDEETGLLVPPGDVQALADALIRLAADPELRADLGTRGRARAAVEFSELAMARRVWELYSVVGRAAA